MCFYFSLVLSTLLLLFALKYAPKEYKLLFIANYCWEGLGAGREGDNRGWDGWMASLTRQTWVWVNSWSWWWTGMHGPLQFMGSQRVRHDWAIELNWTEKGSSDMNPDYLLSSIFCHSALLLSSLVHCFWQHWTCFSSSKFHFFPIQKLCNRSSSRNALPLRLHGFLPPLFELHSSCCSNRTM